MISRLLVPNDNSSTWLLASILILITLPQAGMLPWVPLVLTLIMIGALALYFKIPPKNNFTNENRAWLRVWLAFSLIVLLQLFVIPRLVNWNSPTHNIPDLDLANRPVNAIAIVESWVLFACYWSFAFLVSKLTWPQIKICFYCISAALLFQLTYGVFANLLGQETIIGIWPKLAYPGFTTGSFVNHNHYANYIAITLPLVLTFLCSRTEHHIRHRQPNLALMAVFLIAIILAFGIFGLIGSKSRAGAAIGGIGIVSTFFFLIRQRIQLPPILNLAVILAIILFGLMLANFIGVSEIVIRYLRSSGYNMRWEIWPAIFELPTSMLILGGGAGSFFDVFLLVHPPIPPKTAFYAHNDYLQFLVEYGVLGITILAMASQQMIRLYAQNAQRKPTRHPLQTACIISLVLMAIHSLIDFSLHIPANALVFWFSLGVLFNPNFQSDERHGRKKRRLKRRPKRIVIEPPSS